MNEINDGAPYPVDGRVELKYRLLALFIFVSPWIFAAGIVWLSVEILHALGW